MSWQHASARWRRGANAAALRLRWALSWRSRLARLPRHSPSMSVDAPRVCERAGVRPACVALAFAVAALGIVSLVMVLTVWRSDDGTAKPPAVLGRLSSGSLMLT